jgi:hypothetical protein
MLGRGVLIGWAILALPIASGWWLATYLLYFDDHSDCMGDLSAKLALGASYVGIALAVGALISAWLRRPARLGTSSDLRSAARHLPLDLLQLRLGSCHVRPCKPRG